MNWTPYRRIKLSDLIAVDTESGMVGLGPECVGVISSRPGQSMDGNDGMPSKNRDGKGGWLCISSLARQLEPVSESMINDRTCTKHIRCTS